MRSKVWTFGVVIVLLATAGVSTVMATSPGNPGVYTLDADFDQGTLVNVNHNVADQLQLDSEATPFEFIWVAASGRGTIVKIDTGTGVILGEYWSAPQNRPKNPSRTTVDSNGNVWAGNRDEADGGKGSIVHIGLEENGQCVDRNGNGVIDTSTGLGDIKPWPNAGGVDTNGGVTTAEDECIIHYVRTAGTDVRTVAVDGSNRRLGRRVEQPGARAARLQRQRGGRHSVQPGLRRLWRTGGSLTACCGRLRRTNGCCATTRDPRRQLHQPRAVLLRLGRRQRTTTSGIPSGRTISVVKLNAAGGVAWTKPTGGSELPRRCADQRRRCLDRKQWQQHRNSARQRRQSGRRPSPSGTSPTGVAVDRAGKVWVTNLGIEQRHAHRSGDQHC